MWVAIALFRQRVRRCLPAKYLLLGLHLSHLGNSSITKQCMWSTNLGFSIDDLFFLSFCFPLFFFYLPRFSCLTFQVFKKILQFFFPSGLVLILLIIICFIWNNLYYFICLISSSFNFFYLKFNSYSFDCYLFYWNNF
jgi:hypothetical protein